MGSKVVVSIFVNPAQFDRPEDLVPIPKPWKRIWATCAIMPPIWSYPHPAIMYPMGRLRTSGGAPGISDVLEGEKRPGHFTGVATVVCKLFNLVQPDVAIFGEKDFQQILVIRQMVRDLDINVQIYGAQAVREADGLAMSSRNGYLTPEQRQQAPYLHQTLQEAARMSCNWERGGREFETVQQVDGASGRARFLECLEYGAAPTCKSRSRAIRNW
ncbi:MAG: pantoate--beta-alanine ligase [Thiolinea sp.]